jgi:hypothetical protein
VWQQTQVSQLSLIPAIAPSSLSYDQILKRFSGVTPRKIIYVNKSASGIPLNIRPYFTQQDLSIPNYLKSFQEILDNPALQRKDFKDTVADIKKADYVRVGWTTIQGLENQLGLFAKKDIPEKNLFLHLQGHRM